MPDFVLEARSDQMLERASAIDDSADLSAR
jgi:hypothetical protein